MREITVQQEQLILQEIVIQVAQIIDLVTGLQLQRTLAVKQLHVLTTQILQVEVLEQEVHQVLERTLQVTEEDNIKFKTT